MSNIRDINLVTRVVHIYTSYKVDGKPELRFADIEWYKQDTVGGQALPFIEFKVRNGVIIQPVEKIGKSENDEVVLEFAVDSVGKLNPRLKKKKVEVTIKAYDVVMIALYVIALLLAIVAILKEVL